MTRADLMHGDRPWRLRVERGARPVGRLATALAVVQAVAIVALWAFSVPLAAAAAIWWAWAWIRPVVRLEGGGRRGLSSAEWMEWEAHIELCNAEAEHAAKLAQR